ncbi:MAG: hypothetical protein ACRDYE_15820, partial [Acidimicrobiales bacterium]
MARRVAPVNSRAVALTSTLASGPNTARSTWARSNQGRRAPGETTVPPASSQSRPAAVGKSTSTLNSGAGRRPSGGVVAERVAISTRASARRWAGVRARSARTGSRPRARRASAQSASNSSWSRRSISSA